MWFVCKICGRIFQNYGRKYVSGKARLLPYPWPQNQISSIKWQQFWKTMMCFYIQSCCHFLFVCKIPAVLLSRQATICTYFHLYYIQDSIYWFFMKYFYILSYFLWKNVEYTGGYVQSWEEVCLILLLANLSCTNALFDTWKGQMNGYKDMEG